MTTTEFLTFVASGVSTQEVMEEAERRLAEMRAKSERQKQTTTKWQRDCEELCDKIMNAIGNRVMTASDIARSIGESTQKACVFCKKLVSEERLIARTTIIKEKEIIVYTKR